MRPTETLKPIELSKHQIQSFNRNFDANAFENVKTKINELITNSNNFLEFYQSLKEYEHDVQYTDDYNVVLVECELDRSNMATTADYVGVSLFVLWDDSKNTGKIDYAELYSSESYNKEVQFWFGFNPETYEIESLDQIVW